jgi:hypothetical protein
MALLRDLGKWWPVSDSQARVRSALLLALVFLAGLYAVQLVRPLHLEFDSVCYFQIAERAAEGGGFGCSGCDRTHCSLIYPPGYPAVLAVLIRTGLATPQLLVLLNFACLVAGLAAAAGFWRRTFALDRTAVLGMTALLLLWWPVFRYANNPLSDFLFFALALASVQSATVASTRDAWPRYGALLVSVVLAYAAFKVRTIGIALAPAIVWAALMRKGRVMSLRARLVAHPVAALAGALVLVIVGATAAAVLSHSQYVTVDLRTQYGRGLVPTLLNTWGYRLRDFGALALNLPAGKMPAALRPIVSVIGAAFLSLLVWALWRKRHALGPSEAFAVGIAAIMSVWPFEGVRFWLSVLPVFLGLLAWAARPVVTNAVGRRAVVLVVLLFVAAGLAGQAYNTRLSLAGEQFPMRLGDDYLGPVYREAWRLRPPGDTVPVDSTALRVLRRFEARLRGR